MGFDTIEINLIETYLKTEFGLSILRVFVNFCEGKICAKSSHFCGLIYFWAGRLLFMELTDIKGFSSITSFNCNHRLSSIKGCHRSKVVFHQRLSSFRGCLPSKVIFHQRLSSIEGRLPSNVVFCPGAAPEVPPKWIKQNELGPLDNKLTGTGGQDDRMTDGKDHVLSQADALTKKLDLT